MTKHHVICVGLIYWSLFTVVTLGCWYKLKSIAGRFDD